MKHLRVIAFAIVGAALWPGNVPAQSQLTANELDPVREQIARCWNITAGARDAKDLVIEIRVALNRDGTAIRADIVDTSRANSDPLFGAAAESARRVFFDPNCTPLKLPPEKYEAWKDFVVDFSNPKGASSSVPAVAVAPQIAPTALSNLPSRGDGLDDWCKTVGLPSSIAICSERELRALTIERQHAYDEAKARLTVDQQKVLLADQNGWVKAYPQTCGLSANVAPSFPLAPGIKGCMAQAGRARIVYLRTYAGQSAAQAAAPQTPTPRPPSTQLASLAAREATRQECLRLGGTMNTSGECLLSPDASAHQPRQLSIDDLKRLPGRLRLSHDCDGKSVTNIDVSQFDACAREYKEAVKTLPWVQCATTDMDKNICMATNEFLITKTPELAPCRNCIISEPPTQQQTDVGHGLTDDQVSKVIEWVQGVESDAGLAPPWYAPKPPYKSRKSAEAAAGMMYSVVEKWAEAVSMSSGGNRAMVFFSSAVTSAAATQMDYQQVLFASQHNDLATAHQNKMEETREGARETINWLKEMEKEKRQQENNH